MKEGAGSLYGCSLLQHSYRPSVAFVCRRLCPPTVPEGCTRAQAMVPTLTFWIPPTYPLGALRGRNTALHPWRSAHRVLRHVVVRAKAGVRFNA